MKKLLSLSRIGFSAALLATLGACTVVPAYPPGHYRAPPAYVETYPAYGYSGGVYYSPAPRTRHYEYHDDRRYDDRRRHEMPLPPPMQLHRDIRRSLGLPRLPGMP